MPSSSFLSLSTTDDELTADTEQCGEAIASQKMPKEFLEKFVKMEMELSNSKIRELELENKLSQAELREQKLLTVQNEKQMGQLEAQLDQLKDQFNAKLLIERNELLAKIDEKFSQAEQREQKALTVQNELLAKIAKMEKEMKKQQKEEENMSNNWWDAEYCSDELEIIGDNCLAVHYKGDENYACCRFVFAKHPISSDIFYFEVKVEIMEDWMAIGIATKKIPLDEWVGWHKDSYVYRSVGYFFKNDFCKCEENSSFSAGDVVGCGVHLKNRQIFFTKNGKRLATTFDIPLSLAIDSLFPYVILFDSGDKIEANFRPPFKLDIGTL